MKDHVGILGVGVFLPPDIRRNDFWPAAVVDRWMDTRRAGKPPPAPPLSMGAQRVVEALRRYAADPFQGSVERHVMSAGMTSYDMEERAARDAITRSGVAADEIDLVLTYTAVPEYMVNNSACVLHGRLGLSRECFVMQTEVTAFSFLAQLAIAEAMIASGRARRALLVQSCGVSRVIDPEDPISPLFGDGATAVVVGTVGGDRGILAATHRTDTTHPFVLVGGVRGGTWYDDGRAVLHSLDPQGLQSMFLAIADQGSEVIRDVLARAGVTAADVAFFASHQGTAWIRSVVQAMAGLDAARSLDSFPVAASLFASNVPLVLRLAEDAGMIHEGDLVLMLAGGTGATQGSTLVRWGH